MPEVDTKECCDKWWESLNPKQKMWVHYYFYDIGEHPLINDPVAGKVKEIERRHEFRFVEEGNPRW